MWSADTSPLSPPPPAGARYEPVAPSLLRATTCSNSAFQLLDSPGGGGGDGSPLRQPIRLLPPKAPAGAAAPDVGHLLARGSGSLEVEVGAGAYEAAAWAKRRSSLADAPPASPRIAAGRAPPAAAQLQQPWPGPQDSPEQPPSARPLLRASAASEAGSYIEWSLSTASVGGGWQPPSGPPAEPSSTAAHRVSHFSVSQHAEAAMPREGEELPACSAAGGASTGSDELPSRGHIIAPAAPRYLWSPSTQGDGVAASPPGSSNALAAGSPPLGEQAAGPGSQLVDSPSSPTGGSSSRWHLSRNRRWEQHPIFGLSRDDGVLGAAPGSAAGTAGVAAGAAAATIDGQPWEPALIDSPASATASPALPAWVLAAPPGADPPSPSLPPLQPSASPDMLPRSAAAHSRVHSAVLPQAAAGGAQGGAGQELAGHDPAWSITNSHIDFKLLDSHSSLGASVQGGGAAGSPSPAHQHARPPFLGPGPGSGSPEAAAPVSPTAATAPTEASPHLPGLPPGTYAAALQRFKQVDISHIKRHVGSSPSRKRLALPLLQRLAGSCFNPAGGRLRWRLGRQRVRLLSLARMPYNADDPLHYSAFQAVVAGFGGSWQEVGFTSANPATAELIACGVLGLLHLLLLLERRPDIAAQLRSTAGPAQLASSQHWQPPAMSPALLSVHATLWTVQALRSGLMCRAAQRLKSTYTAAECFYLGAMDCLVSLWCAAGAQGGPALQEALRRAELRAKSNVWPMVSRALAQQAQLQSA